MGIDAIEALKAKPLWTAAELAMVVGLETETIHRQLRQGQVEGAFRVGRTYRIAARPWLEKMYPGLAQEEQRAA